LGRRHGRLLAPAAPRRAGDRDRASHDGGVHRRQTRLRDRPLPACRAGGSSPGRGEGAGRAAGAWPRGSPHGHQAGAGGGVVPGLRSRPRARVGGPGRPHGAPELPRSLRGLPREARAQVPLMKIPETTAVRAFLEEGHVKRAEEIAAFAAREIASRPEPRDDAAARVEAIALLGRLGAQGAFDPIRSLDARACCVVREALGAASPLADAVFALQGLGTLPILFAGDAALKERWVDAAIQGRAMAAFAMTEREAG